MPATFEGRANLINSLRADRAAALYRFRRQIGPLQVETLRVMQGSVDRAYADGVRLYNAGELSVRLSREEAIGNYIDGQARQELRRFYGRHQISEGPDNPVAINRNAPRMSDSTYRRPDARVGNVALDVTLSRKTLSTAQVRAFFDSDFRPIYVIIVRPRQLGPSATYVITRPRGR